MLRKLWPLLLLALPALAGDWFLFASFRSNGEMGVFFSLSQDGRQWAPLNDDKAWIKCQPADMLMRDPFLTRGPDGTWHLLWTWHWTRAQMGGRLKIGHSSSKDLVHWTPQKEIFLFDGVPEAGNAWAPEASWDEQRKEWVIYWATTIKGKAEGHRLYSITTKDWTTFTPVKLWFDPGFSAIDATLARDGKRWVMVFKDERDGQKRLLTAFANSPQGPWREVSKPFSGDWVEGPTVARIGNEWWIYFDHYTKPQYYGAYRTSDWKSFEDVSKLIHFPGETRHGSVVQISEELARQLQAQRR
jgi:hypothetical protein